MRLESNNCYGNGWAGIYLKNANGTVLAENWCWDNELFGIILEQSQNNSLVANNCTNEIYGIRLADSDNNTLLGNTASNCHNGCFDFIRSDATHVTRSVCSFGAIGIDIQDCTGNDVENNSIRNTLVGIFISGVGGNTIWGNRIDWSDHGIETGHGLVNTIEQNNISPIGFFSGVVRWGGGVPQMGIGGYILIAISLGVWGIFLLIKGTLWVNQRRAAKTNIQNNSDLTRLQREHEAILSQLDKDHQ